MNEQVTQIKEIVHRALVEDIGDGDVTTLTILPPDLHYNGRFVAKTAGVVAGLIVVGVTYALIDDGVQFIPQVKEGEQVAPGDVVGTLSGPGQALLAGERVALNFLQRMSGIATLTRRFVDAVAGTSAVILDTRKTVPSLRVLDKWAVRMGGGQNHRFGLYDMALIKDNHITAAGSITEAVVRVRAGDEQQRPVEVEVKTLAELREALALDVDRIMLDNMALEQMQEAVQIANGRIPLEASGNVTLDNVAAIAATGVDYISTGMLTHSVQALDITFLLD